jgi:hypothetical protein
VAQKLNRSGGTGKNKEKPQSVSWFPSRDWSPGTLGYEAGIPTTGQQRSVSGYSGQDTRKRGDEPRILRVFVLEGQCC